MDSQIRSDRSLSALIITYNEEENIGRTLKSLDWVPKVLIIDSGSTDRTLAIAKQYSSVEVVYRKFDSFADQCNYGLDRILTPWVLSLDADYRITKDLAREIILAVNQSPDNDIVGYRIPFRYCVWGRPLRGTLLPPRIALYKRRAGVYRNEGHGHRVLLNGKVGLLHSPILHDDRKSMRRWLKSQTEYMTIEAENLHSMESSKLSAADRLRKHTPFAPFAVLFICLVLKGGLLDGWRGWFYASQRMYTELLLSLLLMDAKTKK